MVDRILSYDHSIVPQETYFDCGPASTQVVLNGRGITASEQDLIREIGTTEDGTADIGLIVPVLNRHLGDGYAATRMPDDPPSAVQMRELWAAITDSIDAGYGLVANIVAPPSNYPRGVYGSTSPAYGGGTVYHYIALMGYSTAADAVWVADSGFRPYGYWIAIEQLATLIPPKGYAALKVPQNGGRTVTKLGLDYAGGRPGGGAIAAAGYTFVVRYLSDGGPGLPGKLLTPTEADDLRANNIDIVGNWETTAQRMLDGYDAGARDAESALAQSLHCGASTGRPIYFSADWDVTPQQQAAIDAYLRGAGTVLLPENVGIYGGYWPVSRALDNGTAAWAWQTGAWSGGRVDSRINLYQRIGAVRVGGVECDVNEARTTDFGQWSINGKATLMALTDEEQRELLEKTREIWTQLRGPDGNGWPQLGANDQGRNLTLVDAVAELPTVLATKITAAKGGGSNG